MPKTYKRRKAPAKIGTGRSRAASSHVRTSSTHKISATQASNTNGTSTRLANRAYFSPRVVGPQSLIFPAMIAAGCWLMAYTLIFLTNDTNRYLLGGLAVLMALLWTFSLGMRVRKLLIQGRSG
jgi:hypothetical protein